MKRLLIALSFVLIAGQAFAAGPFGTKENYMLRKMFTYNGNFGFPAYAADPFTCSSTTIRTTYYNTVSNAPFFCNGTSWLSISGSAPSAPVSITGAADVVQFTVKGNGTQTSDLVRFTDSTPTTVFSVNVDGAGANYLKVTKTHLGSGSSFFIDSLATFPATHSATMFGARFQYTTNGSSAFEQSAVRMVLGAGYSGSSRTIGVNVFNNVVGTGTNVLGSVGGNLGLLALTSSTTAGTNVGVEGQAAGGTESVGVLGVTISTKNSGTNIGVAGFSANAGTTPVRIGVFGGLMSVEPTYAETAALFDNGAVAAPIILGRDNGTTVFSVQDGGIVTNSPLALTAATMTAEKSAEYRQSTHSYTWTNAQVVALGATTSGDITVATLPAKTVVTNAYVVITGQGSGTTTLTVACGRTSASYIDYIVASDAKAAANTVYGDASAERGTNLTGYDLPSYTGTTTINCHFVSTGSNLSAVTGSTGRVILETSLVP